MAGKSQPKSSGGEEKIRQLDAPGIRHTNHVCFQPRDETLFLLPSSNEHNSFH